MHIRLESVLKDYGPTRALDNVSLTIEPGEVVALLGANGAGKTTLLRCLAGVVAPSSGTIFYDNEKFHRGRIEMRRRLMFLPDFPFVFGHMRVLRHIGMVARLYGVEADRLDARVVEILRQFDLLTRVDAPFGRLSRGQTYKAVLTALFAVDPEVWLVDEPFASGIDPMGITYVKEQCRTAASRGHTVFYSTQILDIAESFSDRICVIDRGRVRLYETVERVRELMQRESGALEELFRRLREEDR